MDKKRIQLFITSGLAIIFLITAVNGIKTIAKKKQYMQSIPLPAPAAVPAQQGPSESAQGEPAEKQDVQQQDQDREMIYRDPFKRQASIEPPSPSTKKNIKNNIAGVILTGIIYDTKLPSASYCIINGEVVARGESVDGFIVTEIKEDAVILFNEKEQKEYKVKVWEG